MPFCSDPNKCALDYSPFKKGDKKIIIDYFPASSAGAIKGSIAICSSCADAGGIGVATKELHRQHGDATSEDIYEVTAKDKARL